MPTWLSLLSIVAAGLAAIGLLAGVMFLAVGDPRERAPFAPTRPTTDTRGTLGGGGWPGSVWVHTAPEVPFSVDKAHREMQLHRECRLDGCARKAAAFAILIEAGRAVPDSGRLER